MTRKKKVMLLTVGIITAVFFSTVQTSLAQEITKVPQISMLVVFGDNNVDGGLADPGSLFDRTGGLWPRKPHVGGRNTNGPMVAEYLSEKLTVPIRNYAVSAATTGYKSLFDLFPADAFPGAKNSGVLSQIAEYRRDMSGGKADPNALFIYWAGGNDVFRATSEDVNERIAGAAKNIEQGLKELVALGAKRILVALRPARPKLDSEANNFNIRLNDAITKTVTVAAKTLLFQGVTIEPFDAYAITADMKNNPGSYGFSETSAPCKKIPECVKNPHVAATYVQWDRAHVTTKVHLILAEKIIQHLKKPDTLARSTDEQSKSESKTVISTKFTHESLKKETLSNPHVFVMNSKSNDRDYRIYLSFPQSYFQDDSKLYPALFLFEANSQFATVVKILTAMNLKEELPEMLIVGIGYPTDSESEWGAMRDTDLDLTQSGGGSFLTYIQKELIPLIESNLRVTSDRTVIGYSTGANFGMYVLFNAPETFGRYLIGSMRMPRVIFPYEMAYSENKNDLPARVFLSVGEKEGRRVFGVSRMVETLKGRNYDNLKLSNHIFVNETHQSGMEAAYRGGLRELFKE